MELKFYLNKFIKVDNIEGYTLGSLYELKKVYDKFLEDTEGVDPDFPGISFGKKGKNVISGKTNIENLDDTGKEQFNFSKNLFNDSLGEQKENNLSDPRELRRITGLERREQQKK